MKGLVDAATIGLAMGLAACAPVSKPSEPLASDSGAQPAKQSDATMGPCPALASRNWRASLDAMPGGGGTRLTISGEVDLPTPGYTASWTEGPADRAMPPSQRFWLALTPPYGMVAQVVTPTTVKYEGKATYPAYRSIVVICGDKALATIADIPATR